MKKLCGMAAVLGLFLAVFLFCAKDEGGSGSGTGPTNIPADNIEFSAAYSVSGNQLIMVSDQEIYQYRYCNWNDSLIIAYDTSYAETDTILFSQVDDSFMIYNDAEGMTDTGFVDPAARVEIINVYARQGGGSGIIGTWKSARVGYRVIAGTLTPAEQQDLEDWVAARDADIAGGEAFTVEFSATRITVYEYQSNTYSWADNFIEDWNWGGTWSDSARYNITVIKVSNTAVRLTGNVTGEVVTLGYAANIGETYASSDTAHHAGMVYDDPTSCPNDPPAWYDAFLQANRRPIPVVIKAALERAQKPRPPYSIRVLQKYRSLGDLWR